MKILIISGMRSGKDTFAEILEKYGFKCQSSSMAAAELFIFDALKDKYGYDWTYECFADRVNHRAEWHDLICDYNKDDKARLAKEILKDNDCYIGMRSGAEIDECIKQGLFDLVIWVDASKRVPPEPPDSFNIDESYADIIIQNNDSFESFIEKADRLCNLLSRVN